MSLVFAGRRVYDQISKNVLKSYMLLFFSLPSKHNSGHQLLEELPGDLLCTPLVWVHRGSVILPLEGPYDTPYTGLRSFTILVGTRDKMVSVTWLKPRTDADAATGSP
jgi:hypothetical protein